MSFSLFRSVKAATPRLSQARYIAHLNTVIIQGNVETEAEISRLELGTKVAKFTVSTLTYVRNKENKLTSKCEFHPIVAYGNLADQAEKFIKKGNYVYLEGKLSNIKLTSPKGYEFSSSVVIPNKMSSHESLGPNLESDIKNSSHGNEEEAE